MVNSIDVNMLCRIGRHAYCNGRVARDMAYFPCQCECHKVKK